MTNDPSLVQLVTRVPAALRQRARVYCVEHETTLMAFIIEAITASLDAASSSKRRSQVDRTGS